MRLPIALLIWLGTFLSHAFAQSPALLAALEELPDCGVQCLTTALSVSTCQLTDAACICANEALQRNVTGCVLRSCTVKQALTTKNITETVCGAPVRDRTRSMKIINITLGTISAAVVLLRVVYKAFFTIGELGVDDILVFVSLISGVPSTIITDRGTLANGMGKDAWTLPPSEITRFIEWFYIMEVLYFFQVGLLKLTYLFFYKRIFPAKPVQIALWLTIGFDILFGIAFTITAIFQCKPISFYWNSWDGEHTGKCININALGWANAVFSIALDIWMIAIPLSQLVHLKLAWKKKVGVAMMFCVGTFVTVVSIIRLQTLVSFANTQNPTWDQWKVSLWSTIEINVGIICACMPAIRVVLVRLFPTVLGTTKPNNNYYAKYGSSSRAMGNGAIASSNVVSHQSRAEGGGGMYGVAITKTFEVQHGDNDEVGLVELDDFGSGKGSKKGSGRNSSEVSL